MVDIIDDDQAVRDSTRTLLESYGYQVRDHPSAEYFLRHRGTKPDCLLVDQQMPGMSGLELLEYLRAQGDRTPALMISGAADSTLETRLQRIGVKLLRKPVAENQLMQWIGQTRQAGT